MVPVVWSRWSGWIAPSRPRWCWHDHRDHPISMIEIIVFKPSMGMITTDLADQLITPRGLDHDHRDRRLETVAGNDLAITWSCGRTRPSAPHQQARRRTWPARYRGQAIPALALFFKLRWRSASAARFSSQGHSLIKTPYETNLCRNPHDHRPRRRATNTMVGSITGRSHRTPWSGWCAGPYSRRAPTSSGPSRSPSTTPGRGTGDDGSARCG